MLTLTFALALALASQPPKRYREIGDNRLETAMEHIRKFGETAPGMTGSKDLLFIVQMLSEAASHMLTEGCLRKARQCMLLTRLVGLQVQMLDKMLLNLSPNAVSQVGKPEMQRSLSALIWVRRRLWYRN